MAGNLNYNAQLNQTTTPVSLSTDVIRLAAGGDYTRTFHVFIKTDGSLWSMGNNSAGQLGDGTLIPRSAPVQVASGALEVATGFSHSLFIKPDVSLWAMGANADAQLGDGSTTDRAVREDGRYSLGGPYCQPGGAGRRRPIHGRFLSRI